jgi:hypothetical protein
MVSMRPFLVVLAALLFAGAANARAVEGTVRERGTRAVIPGAVLYLSGGADEAISDETGAYRLVLERRARRVTLRVEAPGYREYAELVRLENSETTKFDVYLVPADDEGGTLIRERRSRANQSRGAHSISEREVNEMPGTYGDPAKAIENFPGMGRVKRSQGSLFVRGATPDDTGVYVDGFQIPDLYHFTGSTSVINIPFVRSVELVPGAFSARFGRATGGLVNITTRKLPTDDVHGFAKLDVIDGGAYIGVPLAENAAIGISARRSYLDVFNGPRVGSGELTDITLIPTYWDYQLKLDWDVQPGHELVVFAFGSGDRELYARDDTPTTEPFRETVESDFHRVSVRYKNILGGGFSNELTGVLGTERRTTDTQLGQFFKDTTGVDLQLREELVWRGDNERITLGIDSTARVDTVRFRAGFADEQLRLLPQVELDATSRAKEIRGDVEQLTLGLYGEGTFEPLEGLTLTPGVRFQSYSVIGDGSFNLEPRFSGQLDVIEGDWGVALKAGAGVFSRAPTAEEILASVLYGRALQTQSALHFQGGFVQGLGDVGELSLNVFSIWRDHITTRAPTFPVSDPDRPFVSPVDSTTAGYSYGVETLLRLRPSKRAYAWISYSIARHELYDGNIVDAVPYPYASEFDTSHLLSFVGQTEVGAGFRIGARYRLASGMPRTDIVGGVLDGDTGRFLPVRGGKAAGRFPLFHALDVRIDWSWLLPWCEVVFYGDLINVLNLRPVEDTEYNFNFTRSEPILGLPTIPTIGAKVTF